jgi:hypothetical protein
MKITIALATILFAVQVQATQIPFRDLTNLVSDADHVLIATVEKVDMIDAKGNQVTNDTARTGPGSENQLRLHVKLDTNGVVASSAGKIPGTIVIPLWQNWHDTLANRRKEVKGKTFIFLLKGNNFLPVYHGLFMRELAEQAEIEAILKRKKSQSKAIDSDKK